MATVRKRRLNTIGDVRRYLAHLVYQVESGKMEPQTGAKLGYLVNILVGTIKDGDLEERVKNLELQAQGDQGHGKSFPTHRAA